MMNYQGYHQPAMPTHQQEGNMNYPNYPPQMKSHPSQQNPPNYPQHQMPHQQPSNQPHYANYNQMPTHDQRNYQPYDNRPPHPPQTHSNMNYPGYTPPSNSNMMHNYPPHPSSYQTNAFYGTSSSIPPNNYSNNAPYTSNDPSSYGQQQPRHPYNNMPYASNPSVSPRNEQIRQPYNSNPNAPPPRNQYSNVTNSSNSYVQPPQPEYKQEPYPSNSPPNVPQRTNMSNKRSHSDQSSIKTEVPKTEPEESSSSPDPSKKACYDNVPAIAPSSVDAASEGKDTLPLNNGRTIPIIQFGTYKMKGPESKVATLAALKNGYKGLDTASVYDNEKEVGEAIVESGVPRENLFIQTKLWRSFTGRGKNGKPKCDTELNKSLRKLGTKYIDCWLMHWPGPGRHLNYPPVRQGMDRPKVKIEGNATKMVPEDWTPAMRLDTFKEMSKHIGSSVRSVGVCNFSVRQLQELLEFCKANNIPKPAVVQNECHPLLIASDVRNFCAKEGIVFQAYASLGAGSLGLLDNTAVKQVAHSHMVTPAQVLLRWGLQLGCALLPKSCNPERQKKNLDIWRFKLSEEEMTKISSCDKSVPGQNTMAGWLREHDPDFY